MEEIDKYDDLHDSSSKQLEFDNKLRPVSFEDFSGQNEILKNLKVFVTALFGLHWVTEAGPTTRVPTITSVKGPNPYQLLYGEVAWREVELVSCIHMGNASVMLFVVMLVDVWWRFWWLQVCFA